TDLDRWRNPLRLLRVCYYVRYQEIAAHPSSSTPNELTAPVIPAACRHLSTRGQKPLVTWLGRPAAGCYNRAIAGGVMKDQYGRELKDLRISLTDRCNLRCVYCMPAEGIDFRPAEELLADHALLLLVRVAAELGVRR